MLKLFNVTPRAKMIKASEINEWLGVLTNVGVIIGLILAKYPDAT